MEWSLNNISKNAGMYRNAYFTLVIIFLLFFINCNTKKPDNKLSYYYYPDKNVYYDPANKIYFYSLDGTKNWSTFAANNTNPDLLGEKVIVYSNTTEVYRDNENHRKLYKGRLYDINTTISTFNTTTTEVAERKVEHKKTLVPVKVFETKKQKKGIGKFISKIFGKHK